MELKRSGQEIIRQQAVTRKTGLRLSATEKAVKAGANEVLRTQKLVDEKRTDESAATLISNNQQAAARLAQLETKQESCEDKVQACEKATHKLGTKKDDLTQRADTASRRLAAMVRSALDVSCEQHCMDVDGNKIEDGVALLMNIDKAFTGTTVVDKLEAVDKAMKIKQRPNENIGAFILRGKEVQQRVKTLKITIEDAMVQQRAKGLNSRFLPVVRQVTIDGGGTLDKSKLEAALRLVEGNELTGVTHGRANLAKDADFQQEHKEKKSSKNLRKRICHN